MAWLLLVRSAALGWLPISKRPVPSIKQQNREQKTKTKQREVMRVNVSGRLFQIYKWQLDKYPTTLLGSDEREYFYDEEADEYFFDRDPDLFRCILAFYRTGRLHYPRQECVTAFLDDLAFFGIDGDAMEECCYEEFKEKEREAKERIVDLRSPDSGSAVEKPLSIRQKLYASFENPQCSMFSLILYYVTGFFIVVSVGANIVETVPCGFVEEENTVKSCGDRYNEAFFVIDTACVCIFTMEYILRLIAAPNTWKFLRSVMSIIDIAAIMPYYITLLISESSGFSGAFVTLRVFRVFRIFKFSRHSAGLRILGYTLQACASELGFLVFSLAMAVIIFSTMMYYCEKGVPRTRFTSIPATFWYTIVTITTLGYGDMVPHTTVGKIVGAICSLSGVLVIALPVPVIVSNFARIYQQSQRADKRQLQFKVRLRRLKVARDAAADLYVNQKERRAQLAAESLDDSLHMSQAQHRPGRSLPSDEEPQPVYCKGDDAYAAQHHHLLACLESVTQRNICSSRSLKSKGQLDGDGAEPRGRLASLRRSFRSRRVTFDRQSSNSKNAESRSNADQDYLSSMPLKQISTDQDDGAPKDSALESVEVVGFLQSEGATTSSESPVNSSFSASDNFATSKNSSEVQVLPQGTNHWYGSPGTGRSKVYLEEHI